jgi:glycogen synthase kinase 3 beta
MEYFNDNLFQIIQQSSFKPFITKIYTFQILRGLNYLATLNIAHRDIKPQNILIDNNTHKLVICDFGSAKKLVDNEINIAYICSRCYRAP